MRSFKHGRDRMQQRSIPEQVIDLIITFGSWTRRHGADVFFMTKEARSDVRRHLGSTLYAVIERKLDAYVVVSDCSSVITVGYRLQHMRRA